MLPGARPAFDRHGQALTKHGAGYDSARRNSDPLVTRSGDTPSGARPPPHWSPTRMAIRRASVLLISLLTASGLATLLWQGPAPGGWPPAKLVMAAAFAGTAPWTGLCLANGLIGFVIL